MTFWEALWFVLVAFALVAYLVVFFSILADLVRDRDTSGWAKAVWVLALIVLPIITSVVYLIVRGREMNARAAGRLAADRAHPVAAAHRSAVGATRADQIAQARAMLDDGVISVEEFERLKEKALV